ncbi:MAG: RNA polymerase sigma factor [Planctomycetota bacterium]|jgi:RNA polymerase sigma-70 factor (ECF subfamily)
MASNRQQAVAKPLQLSSVVPLSDEEAMLRVQNSGDTAAFALLVQRWQRPIRRLCARMTGDEHRAEDLTQETFARAFAQRETFRREARMSTFLWRIALNLCSDERRATARRAERSLDDGPGECNEPRAMAPAPHALAAQRERAGMVREALAQLPEYYRSVVVLRHYEGLKFREIAHVLNIPEGTVKSRMAEALNRLARLLGPKMSPG